MGCGIIVSSRAEGNSWNQDNPLQEGIYSAVTFYAYGEVGGAIAGKVFSLAKGAYLAGVATRSSGIVVEAEVATKTVTQYTKSSLKLGQQMHKAYKVGTEGLKEFRLPSGRRIDFLDIKNSAIYELKPFNPRAMKAGLNQLNIYMEELQTMPQFNGVNWKTVLDTY